MDDGLAFCTLGMFIIDEIEYINGKGSEHSIIGGAGTYAAIGARLAAGSHYARRVGWIVDMGSDFPSEFKTIIDAWQTSCLFRIDPRRLTTRAWNGYGPNEYRAFKYLTPKLRLEEYSLSDDQVLAKSFHMVCSPIRCISLVHSILERRSRLRGELPSPVFVWEPVPDLCTPEELVNLQKAAAFVDIISPNGDELAAFFSSVTPLPSRKAMVANLLPHKGEELSDTAVIVRDGADGSRLYMRGAELHLRAFHQHGQSVVDPTGGGNTYLGALAVAMTGMAVPEPELLTDQGVFGETVPSRYSLLLYSMIHATIAASFAIEQTGMPSISNDDADVWNGVRYQDRFFGYVNREKKHISAQVPKLSNSD